MPTVCLTFCSTPTSVANDRRFLSPPEMVDRKWGPPIDVFWQSVSLSSDITSSTRFNLLAVLTDLSMRSIAFQIHNKCMGNLLHSYRWCWEILITARDKLKLRKYSEVEWLNIEIDDIRYNGVVATGQARGLTWYPPVVSLSKTHSPCCLTFFVKWNPAVHWTNYRLWSQSSIEN